MYSSKNLPKWTCISRNLLITESDNGSGVSPACSRSAAVHVHDPRDPEFSGQPDDGGAREDHRVVYADNPRAGAAHDLVQRSRPVASVQQEAGCGCVRSGRHRC